MTTIEQSFSACYSFPVCFTRDAFAPSNSTLTDVLRRAGERSCRLLVVLDSGVAQADPALLERIGSHVEAHRDRLELAAAPLIVRGGEACKNNGSEVERIQAMVGQLGMCRHSFILAIGGGAVLDAAGFAAATAHRGIRLIRMPSTTLAQNDAGVGVKNGINAFGRKNFLGCFAPPFAVINDFNFLQTLAPRDLRAGISEAVKVALVRDAAFFESLYAARAKLAAFEAGTMENSIMRCAKLHLEHIATSGDPFESGSSRPLDFGHWVAHKLEDLSSGEIRHGEAVAIGIALDALYSCRTGLLGSEDLHRILTLLQQVGFNLYHRLLDDMDLPRALREFQEHLGGELSIPLLKGIGEQVECHELAVPLYREGIAALAAGTRKSRKRETMDEQEELPDDETRHSGSLLHGEPCPAP
jgi:3-dehydroquinate synthase